MTTIAVTREPGGEARIGLSPETAKKFIALGCRVRVETGAGSGAAFADAAYAEAGAVIAPSAGETRNGADIMIRVARPPAADLAGLKEGAVVAAILDPFDDHPGLEAIAATGVSCFAMDLMPRITRAQSMDVLSSQSNLAGYKAVIDAAAAFAQAMPMMMTAAGTVPPAKVFVMGAGVAGLQAIATARRLGAIVTATDVRPAAKEQVESLGAKFIAVEDEEFRQAETAGGYAKEMSDAYKKKQAELVARHVAGQDIVITTALIPGRPAPRLISAAMVEAMHPGAIIVDLAAERGGNCELVKAGETIDAGGVMIMGPVDIAARLAVNASNLLARNFQSFLATMIDPESGDLAIDWDDELIKGTLVTKGGKIVHPALVGENG